MNSFSHSFGHNTAYFTGLRALNWLFLRVRLFIFIATICFLTSILTTKSIFAQTSQKYGDWQVFCTQTTPSVKETCRMVQSHALDKDNKTIFMFSLIDDSNKGGLFGLVTVPLEIYLAPGIVLDIGDKKPYKVLYEMCNSSGCHGGFKMTTAIEASFKAKKPITAKVWTTTNKALSVTLSAQGYDEALKRLKGI